MENILLSDGCNTINYYEVGDRRNPLIVCLHGLAGNAPYTFDQLSTLLEKDFHLIMVDQPGHGLTSPLSRESDYLFSSLAQWLQKLIRQVTDKPFYILGHSWGADIALHYSKFFPESILGVILLDGGYTFPVNQPEMTFEVALSGWNTYMDQSTLVEWETVLKEYKEYTSKWDDRKEKYVRTLFYEENNLYTLIPSKFTILSIIKAFFSEPFTSAYPYIQVPLLLLHATLPRTLDKARGVGFKQLEESMSELAIIAMENAGHMIQWDQPEQTALEIKKWVMQQKMKKNEEELLG
ncbi:alpha/beta hydrolase [Psychrobacillus sp. FSL W7-1493]|uniref:alpha/beta fold hydrolase n=1 Tax=Psychrobacillus sp. FSL W7-1493 TaxID=2921552 RepID=UPI0030FACF55